MLRVGDVLSRQRCLVPFCGRTRRDDGKYAEWICGKHWRLADRLGRRVYRHRQRSTDHHSSEEKAHFVNKMWYGLKKQVLERAAGISA